MPAVTLITADDRADALEILSTIYGRIIPAEQLSREIQEANDTVQSAARKPFTYDGQPAPADWFNAFWWLADLACREASIEEAMSREAADFEDRAY